METHATTASDAVNIQAVASVQQDWAMLAKEVVKQPTSKPSPRQRSVMEHNRRTCATALQCAAVGLPVVDVHSIDDGGPCTCQWGASKREAEGRPPLKPCPQHNWGKHPRGESWQKGKTLNPEHIKARWGAARGHLNVGVVYGSDCRTMLVDVDGPRGAVTVARWRAELALPETVTVISGSGGQHLYYRVPEGWDIRNSTKSIGDGVDTRGENGFSVAPGSRHYSGVATNWADGVGIYRWQDDHSPDEIAIADAPIWLLRLAWFAFNDRRHATAPDGSAFSDAGLEEWATETASEAATSVTTSDASDDADRLAKAAGQAAKELGAGAKGWEAKVELIGHGSGLDSFDGAILVAANSYFGTFGYDADAAPLKSKLLDRIGIAPEDTPGHRDRYLSDDYLDPRIQQARDFVKSKGGESLTGKAYEPRPEAFADQVEIDAAIADITEDTPGKAVEALMLRLHLSGFEDNGKRMLVRRIARQIEGPDGSMEQIKTLYDDVVWYYEHGKRPDTTDRGEVWAYMSGRYAAVRWGKDFVYVDLTRQTITPLAKASLVAEYNGTKIVIPNKAQPDKPTIIPNWFAWYDQQPNKLRYDDVVFIPRGHVVSNKLNAFRGSGIKPIKGDWSLLRRHIFENICKRNPYRFAYLICTIASWVQRPDIKYGVAIVLRGKKGTGKSKLAEWLLELMPYNSGTITSPEELFSDFNGVEDAKRIIVNVDEAIWGGDRRNEGKFKAKITGPKQSLHPKGFDRIEVDDFHHYILTTNSDWVVPASFDERRFFILDVSDRRAKDTKYFSAIDRQMEAGGLEAFLYDLTNLVISDWVDLRNPPVTKALIKQAEQSGDAHEMWWREGLRSGQISVPIDREMTQDDEGIVHEWPDDGKLVITTRDAQLSYKAFARDQRAYKLITDSELGTYLKDVCGEEVRFRESQGDASIAGRSHRAWCYELPPLADLRDRYTKTTGVRFDELDQTELPDKVTEAILGSWCWWGMGAIRPH